MVALVLGDSIAPPSLPSPTPATRQPLPHAEVHRCWPSAFRSPALRRAAAPHAWRLGAQPSPGSPTAPPTAPRRAPCSVENPQTRTSVSGAPVPAAGPAPRGSPTASGGGGDQQLARGRGGTSM
ncbi:cyclin-dependent kinase inhibitor 1C-like [Hordeum vulgare subsp. vulgare]|uniref:cyclin-dependent kinase inhibitor 1C-like n=1 Tax=Hordeum vulgare subsp. vulgare TaxID=112509 RepID=UPI001D1A442A|nr:cyclin-dependent kinase inhibitor 1C-like [Hordeum vulgare subsp. vulgare]